VSAIFGILGRSDLNVVRRMGQMLRHRGARLAVLAIADNATFGAVGQDPDRMIVESDGVAVVAEGALYNDDEIGAGPAGASAATAFAALDLASHPERLDRINGDFAMATYRRGESHLLFARDFFGTRPLYVCRLDDGALAFASEYKALLAARGAPVTVDVDMVQYLQCAKRLPVGRTLAKEFVEPAPGAVSRFSRFEDPSPVHAYPPLEVDIGVRDESAAIPLILREFRRAVERRIAGLDSIGLALSGGIDSIALAFLMRELRPDGEIYTFSAGSGYDDRELMTAARVAKAIGSKHHEIVTPPEMLEDRLPDLVWHLEDPYSRSEALQLFEVGRAAAGKVDVLFSAQGADGLFAGMPKYRLLWLADKMPWFRTALQEFYFLTQFGIKPRTPVGRLFDYVKYRGQVAPVPVVRGASMPSPAPFPEAGPELINRAAARGFQAGVCQDIHKFERNFSAFGLEHRSPFYDLNLVRAAYTITDRLKITRKAQKYIFRKAMANIVPDEFRQIPKFPQRMRYDQAFADILDAVGRPLLMGHGGLAGRGIFEESSLRRLFRAPGQEAYRDEAAMRIWTAMNTELWLRAFTDRRREEQAVIEAAVG
jgi:asparagine synthase (glutamine-hydrolysing)